MKRSPEKISVAVFIAAFGLISAQVACGDDTEVFVGQAEGNTAAGRTNILFIIDNSASMSALVETQVPWNPAVQFSGCYRSDAVYFSTSGEPPPCDSQAFVDKTANRCADSQATLADTGQYLGSVRGWDASQQRWEPLVEGDPGRLLECEADRGVDGDGGERYAADGPDGPWAADASLEPAWNTQYTLFDGNWLNWRTNPPSVSRTRLDVIKEVVDDLLDTIDGVNVGLMQFNFDEGGAVTHAIADITTARDDVKAAVDQLTPFARTPLSETLYEATLYFRGDNVDYGNIGPVRSVAASRVNGDPDGQRYLSPITAECQKNFIVLLTDGEPLSDDEATFKILGLPQFSTLVGTSCDGTGDGHCLDDLAEYLFKADLDPGRPGVQNAVVYTIGFAVDAPILQSTATRGGGRYYVADDTGSLTAALSAVISGISEASGTFAAPAIPVSTFNRSTGQRDAFVSVFQPSTSAHWPGNLKKYRFSGNELVGQDGRNAVDPATGFFASNAFSFWSQAPDGDRVRAGGAANRLPAPAMRNVYTNLDRSDDGEAQLTSSGNRVEVGNSAITAAMLGVAPQGRDNLINWIRGSDIRDIDADGDTVEPRHEMGDPLHVRPVTVNYGPSAERPETTVFVATNDGLLQSIDADTGIENWAFLPSRLLSRQNDLMLNPPSSVKRYGLDGEIRLFVHDNDGQPGISDSDEAILVFGMGRGGDAVYAVDIHQRTAPRLMWQIDGATPGFASLGQVWAAPEVARVDVGGTVHRVIVLTGGYDDAQDNRGYRPDAVGNAIFLVDLFSGELLWSAGAPDHGHDLELPAMTNSIPAAPRVLDMNGDGLADRLYVADTGGRLLRFDILNGSDRTRLGEGGVLASLGAADLASPPASEVRRFYITPDVVLVDCIRGNFLAINLGSGYRGHPLDTDVEDAFFSVRDPNVFGAIPTADYQAPIRVGELLDITDEPDAFVPSDAAGWRIRLTQDPGEKVLSNAVTFNNTIFFTSFSPAGNVSACAGGIGVNRAYQVDACHGRPLTNLDGSTEPGPLSVDDRFRVLAQTGIAPSTTILLPDNATEPAEACTGPTCFAVPGNPYQRTYWVQEPAR